MTKARDIASAAPAPSTVSATELGYLDGVTSAIQTQIDSKIGSASAISPTLIDAKGDLIVGSAADTAARLAVGTNDHVLTADSSATNGVKWAALPAATGSTIAVFADNKNSGTDGGTFTSGAYRTRDLNTTYFNNITGCSLSSNQITLPAGTYEIMANAPSFDVNASQLRFYNITDSAVVGGVGSQNYNAAVDENVSPAILTTAFTITGTKVFELQHRCETTKSTNGLGISVNFGTECFSQIKIVKVA